MTNFSETDFPDDSAVKQNKWKDFADQTPNNGRHNTEKDTENGEDLSVQERAQERAQEQEGITGNSELSKLKESHLRLLAEISNVRDRAARDVSNAHRFGIEKLLRDLLPVVDSMVRALDMLDVTDPGFVAVRDGIRLTLDMFYSALAKHGVSVIAPAVGERFEPELHEAVSMQPATGLVVSNTIARVLQQGYALHGRVVRAAMVVVAVAA